MFDYDVIIIGGGPSGLSAATTTAKNGLNTAVIEEHSEIGHPLACGEGISVDKLLSLENMPKTNNQLDDESLPLQSRESFIERTVSTQRFFFWHKRRCYIKFKYCYNQSASIRSTYGKRGCKNGSRSSFE